MTTHKTNLSKPIFQISTKLEEVQHHLLMIKAANLAFFVVALIEDAQTLTRVLLTPMRKLRNILFLNS